MNIKSLERIKKKKKEYRERKGDNTKRGISDHIQTEKQS